MTPQDQRFLAVVPARGGSKRIPRKNIRPFCGVPLLQRTLEVVIGSGVFDAVVVSTDDPEISQLARSSGAEVPFQRPAHLSDDWTGTAPVVAHAIGEVFSTMGNFASVCCIYSGAVLITSADFVASSQLASLAGDHDAVVAAVVRYGHPIQRALKLQADGLMAPARSLEALMERTQDLEPMWHDAGQFYWASPARWGLARPLLSAIVPYEVPAWRVQDIDTEDDWTRAELLYLVANSRNAV